MFVNLQRLLVQSSKWLGISSVQFSYLVTSLSGKFVQFSSGHGSRVPPFSSFSSFHELFWPWLGLTWLARFSPSSLQLFRRSRGAVLAPSSGNPSPPAGVCRLGGGMVRSADCAHWLVVGVVWCRSDTNPVQKRLNRVRSGQLACLIESAVQFISLSSVLGTGPNASVQFVQFSLFSSAVNSSCPAGRLSTWAVSLQRRPFVPEPLPSPLSCTP